MPLGILDAVRPIQSVKALQQTVCVSCDAHHPLPHGFFDHGMATPLTQTIFDFVVGQHGSQGWAPVDFAVGEIGDAKGHEHFGTVNLRHALPVRGCERTVEVGPKMWKCQMLPPIFIASGMHVEVAVVGKRVFQLGDGARGLGMRIVPAFEQLPKNPLGPFVITGITCADFAGPIKAKPQLFQLPSVPLDVLIGCDGRMLAGLDGVLLCRQPKAVVPHRMQHVVPFVAFVSRMDV